MPDRTVRKWQVLGLRNSNKLVKQPTVGIDFVVTNITHLNRLYRLQLWDTAGQERFKSLIPSYLRDSHCAIILYDAAKKETSENVFKWLDLFRDHVD